MSPRLSRFFQLFFLGFGFAASWEARADVSRFPLSTRGSAIVDREQQRFKLKSVNWYGPSVEAQVVAGLDHQPIEHIVRLIKDFGFNSVRLPFSNQMLHDRQAVKAELIRANPQFLGKTPLEVFDATVSALTDAGLAVVLNNHTTYSEWCCNFDTNGLWYHSGSSGKADQTVEAWEQDWLMLVDRYRDNKAVVAADLRNEVRTSRIGDSFLPNFPNWGYANKNDWHKAAQELGQKILDRNPDILIVVEGINWEGTIAQLGSGSRPHLKPVRDLPVRLPGANKLVYAAHNYGYVGPQHNGEPKVSRGPRYSDMSEEVLRQTLDSEWGYVTQPGQYYTAPVWVSEFGAAREGVADSDKAWFRHLITYMIDRDSDFAYWPLNHEAYGLVNADWSRTYDDDWRIPELKRLLAADRPLGSKATEALFSQLDIRRSDDQQLSQREDWLAGAHKGSCPTSMRMVGLSRDHRALCSDIGAASLAQPASPLRVTAVNETTQLPLGDWANGFTKYECPQQYFVIGFSKHPWGTSGVLCAPSRRPLSYGSCNTLWFDQADQRASLAGGDWARKSYKGQCADREYMAGLAQRDGKASAILCCALD